MNAIVNFNALPARELATVAPNWSAMKLAIVQCSRLDEVKCLSDKVTAMRVYYAQSRDTENELSAMRIRLRAERRLGELIAAEQEAGRVASKGQPKEMSQATTLSEMGISRDRSARAQNLALVPEDQFEAALLSDKPSATSLAALVKPRVHVDVQPVLKTWGVIRDFAAAIDDGSLLKPEGWTTHPGIQSFQIEEVKAALPVIDAYLTQLKKEI